MTGVNSPRGTSNANNRGNAAMRRWRKLMLLERDGDGHTAPCHTCGREVDYHSMIVDCHPIPRVDGGRYDLKSTKQPEESNNQIHCVPCSHNQGGKLGTERKRAKNAAVVAALVVSFDVS